MGFFLRFRPRRPSAPSLSILVPRVDRGLHPPATSGFRLLRRRGPALAARAPCPLQTQDRQRTPYPSLATPCRKTVRWATNAPRCNTEARCHWSQRWPGVGSPASIGALALL